MARRIGFRFSKNKLGRKRLDRIPRAAELEVIGLRRFYPSHGSALKASMHEMMKHDRSTEGGAS